MASTFITRTPSSNGSETKSTLSMWLKRSGISADQSPYFSSSSGDNKMIIRFNADDTFDVRGKVGGSFPLDIETNRKFRDPHAWMHFVFKFDTTQATAADRFKMYVNGVQETSFSTETYPSQNTNLSMNQTDDQLWIGSESGTGSYFNGSITHVHWTDGYAYDASTFGETDSTTGIWKPKSSPSVTYGTNGFFLKFENSANMDLDSSGNNLSFTTSGNLTQSQDNPENNFCTLSPLGTASSSFTLIEGNLYSGGADNNWRSIFGTLGAITGKYYYEVKIISTANEHIGIASSDQMAKASDSAGKFTASTYGAEGYAYTNGGQKSNNGTDTNWGNSYTTNDIIGVAFDLDNSKIYFSKNGTWQESGDPTSGSTGTGAAYTLVANKFYLPAMASYGAASNMAFNFGNGYFRTTAISSEGTNASGIGKFEYDVPTGYTALSTKGLNE